MALTEIEVSTWNKDGELGSIGVKRVIEVLRDGVKIAEGKPHRKVIAPGDDYSGEAQNIQTICAALHTPEVIAAYKALMAENAPA